MGLRPTGTVKTPASPADEVALLAAARQRPQPVYLLIGESFQTEAVARRLIDVLVPPERRSFNLEIYDGRTAPIGPILDSLRMPGLFSGNKVIWVREPAVFLSAEKRSEIAQAMVEAWRNERHAEAAEKLLSLSALAGWTQDRFETADWGSLKKSEIADLLGRAAEPGELPLLREIREYCRERNLRVAAYRDESGALDEFLQRGVPAGSVLIFTAALVDRRKRIVKTVIESGAVLELSLERERSGALSANAIEQLIRRALEPNGKRLTAAARRLIGERAGSDPAIFASELEKLCLYVGEAETIGEDDVRASWRDLGESWIFDFTRALSQRDAASALRLLRGLFQQGEHPLYVLALIARELRLLLLARDCLTGPFSGKWSPRVTFTVFRDRLLPLLDEQQRAALGGVHPYVLYLALQNASRIETGLLHRAVLALQQLDVKLKSSAGDPRILVEAFVLEVCREPDRPRQLADN